jgi:glycosyltransferase involved in cell wall biosynthesis
MTEDAPETRVAILSPIYRNPGSPYGGITPVVRNLTRGLAGLGILVDLLIRQMRGSKGVPEELPGGVRVIDLDTHHRLTTVPAVARYLREVRPRALLGAGHRFNISAAWVRYLARDSRIFLSVHNTMSREVQARGAYRRWQRRQAISRFYPLADGIIAVSDGVAEDLVQHFGIARESVSVIHNPIVTDDLIRRAGEPLSHPWFTGEGPPVILSVGRLSRQKAFGTLIRAFEIVRRQLDCRLIILGEGPERGALEALAESLGVSGNVQMPGFEDNPVRYMAHADVFALSSDYEGFGNVLVEALAAGAPVVSTDCPSGPAEILDGGRYGRLVTPGDPPALADAIMGTLRDPRAVDQGRAAVRPYEADTVAKQYAGILCPDPDDAGRGS